MQTMTPSTTNYNDYWWRLYYPYEHSYPYCYASTGIDNKIEELLKAINEKLDVLIKKLDEKGE